MLSMFYRQENLGVTCAKNLRQGTKPKIARYCHLTPLTFVKNLSLRLKLFAVGFLQICKISCLVANMVAYGSLKKRLLGGPTAHMSALGCF
jgi:hypothetical protein